MGEFPGKRTCTTRVEISKETYALTRRVRDRGSAEVVEGLEAVGLSDWDLKSNMLEMMRRVDSG